MSRLRADASASGVPTVPKLIAKESEQNRKETSPSTPRSADRTTCATVLDEALDFVVGVTATERKTREEDHRE